MEDRQLATRNLAETTGTDAPDTQEATDKRGASGEMTPADEPMARERSEKEQEDRPLSQPVELGPLLPDDQSERFTTRWQEIQASFVDQPRDSVEQADALVADLMQRLAAGFSNERERLEAQWDRGDDVSTEDLRVALTRYRSFFDRLLSA
jgi:hypothetical protein